MNPEEVKLFLEAAVRKQKAAGSFLLSGGSAEERRDLGLWFARLLCCEGERKPCGECLACRNIEKDVHPDVRRVIPEKRMLSIDEVRQVKEEIYRKPYLADRKIYLFEVDAMKDEAANAFLKILEEPPAYGVLVLLTSSVRFFLPTIVSRCRCLRLNLDVPASSDAYLQCRDECRVLLDAVRGGDMPSLFSGIESLVRKREREDVEEWIGQAVLVFRDRLFADERMPAGFLVRAGDDDTITTDPLSEETLERLIELKSRVRANVNMRLALESFFLNL